MNVFVAKYHPSENALLGSVGLANLKTESGDDDDLAFTQHTFYVDAIKRTCEWAI